MTAIGLSEILRAAAVRRVMIGVLTLALFSLVVAYALLARPTYSGSTLVEVNAERAELPASHIEVSALRPGAPLPHAALSRPVTLTFNDDFDDFDWNQGFFRWNAATRRRDWISTSRGTWTTQYHWGRTIPNNRELQYYSDASVGLHPFRIADGALVIAAGPSPDRSRTDGLPYTSGVITTHGSFAQRYGYFEVRVRLQPGQGLWPAFWLINEDRSYPPEIDVMEVVNSSPIVHHNLHSVAGGHYRSFHREVRTPGLFDRYHTFGVSWRPDVVEYYVNGRKTHVVATPADLHSHMYMIINLAVGGNWPGAPDRTTRFPAEMRIDYVRAWQYLDLM